MSKDNGVPPTGSGCEASPSAAKEASSQSRIPNAGLFADLRFLRTLLDAEIAKEGRVVSFMVRAGLLSDLLDVVESTAFRTSLIGRMTEKLEAAREQIVELWHESEAGREPLPHYLGMTEAEYAVWAVYARDSDGSGEAGQTAKRAGPVGRERGHRHD